MTPNQEQERADLKIPGDPPPPPPPLPQKKKKKKKEKQNWWNVQVKTNIK